MQSYMVNLSKLARRQVSKVLIMLVIIAMIGQSMGPVFASTVKAAEEEPSSGYLDKLIFGDAESETAHNFIGEFTTVVSGLFGESARVSSPRVPVQGQGGDLTFTMKVDPYMQNYITVKFSGEDNSNGLTSMVNINGEQVGYIRNGDYENINKGWVLPNRFIYSTVMLPLEATRGKESIEISIKTFNPWGNMTQNSRGFYNAYTHTQAYIDVDDETQGYKLKEGQTPESLLRPGKTEAEKQALIDQYNQGLINDFNNLLTRIQNNPNEKMSIVRYQDELKFYAEMLKSDLSPAKTNEDVKQALDNIFQVIDNHVKDYYGNTRLVLRGGHQGDWGGYYSALGEALYIVENLIRDVYGEEQFDALLDEPFATGTVDGPNSLAGVDWEGGELTRREAWERVLKANFDFARSRLSYIYNQVYYTYVGAWEAHEGLRIIDSEYYEGKERSNRILLESLGGMPFLGEEVLVGPDGEELDVYHSLFYHDGQAVFTDDTANIIGKGLAKSKLDENGEVVRRLPYGENYYGLTEGGLTRENGFVANYGESANYLVDYFFKTLDHAGDEQMNQEILKLALKSIHARGYVRYMDINGSGHRVMVTEAVTDERNPGLPGFEAYGTRLSLGMGLKFAYLEKHMAEHKDEFNGSEWEEYWDYARAAVGFVQQQMADNQFWDHSFGHKGSMSGLNFYLQDAIDYVTETRADYFDGEQMAGVVMPHTDFDYYTEEEIAALSVDPADYEQFAWADIDNLYVSMRDEDVRIFGALFYRNRGLASNGRMHVVTDTHDRIVQIATNNQFRYEDYYLRDGHIDWDFQSDSAPNWTGAPQALAGEPNPISYQPGVGTVNRENFEVDTPYSGYPELLTVRYGKYYIIFNTTRESYGNEASFDVELPADFSGSTVLDIVTGADVAVADGKVTIAPMTAMVLKLTSDIVKDPKPSHVDFVHALPGNGYVGVTWKTTSGGEAYTIKRSESENGAYEVIASGLTGNYYRDTSVENGKMYYYKVAAVNEYGAGWDSWHVKADLSQPASVSDDSVWRDDRIGTASGTAVIDGSMITITGADGAGFGIGDDYKVHMRDVRDSFHAVSQVSAGITEISARIDSASGEDSGIMLRDRLTEDKARYVYFGADAEGNLVLKTRTRESIHQWSNEVVSPLIVKLDGYTVAEYPYVKLVQHHDSQSAYALVSKDGDNWTYVTKVESVMTFAYHTGVVASDEAQFSDVQVNVHPRDSVITFITQDHDQAVLNWTKPKQAGKFYLYRTADDTAGELVLMPGSTEPVEGSPWKLVLAGTTNTSYTESNLRYGNVHYRILPVEGDGEFGDIQAASVSAYPIEAVLEDARNITTEGHTIASAYLYDQELDRIAAEMSRPDADIKVLIDEIYKARDLLEPYTTVIYGFNGDASNVYGLYDGTVTGEPEYVEGKFGQAIDLDGTNHVTIPAISELANADELTVSLWVNWAGGNQWQRIFDFGRDTNHYMFLSPRSGNNTLRFAAKNGGGEQMVQTASQLPTGEWTHVAVTLGGGSAKLYVNGSLAAENHSFTIKPSDIVPSLNYIGKSMFAADPLFFGSIDDFRVDFRELHAEEIMDMYNDTSTWLDSSLLTLLLDEAADKVEEHYTADSYAALLDTVADAQAVASAENVTQDDVDAAADGLLAALDGLQYIAGLPVLDPIGNKFVMAGSRLTFTVHATNADEIEYEAVDLPEGATFDEETRTFEWTPDEDQGGIYTVTFTVTSGELTSSRQLVITVKGLPTIGEDTSLDAVAKETLNYQVPASDPLGSVLTYRAENLPNGAYLDPATGVLMWVPAQADYGKHTVTIIVSNGDFEVSQQVEIQVRLNVLPPFSYTKGSYYLYMKEVDRIEAAMNEPAADKVKLAAELDAAEGLLISTTDLPAERIGVSQEMVIASSRSWDGRLDPAQNGWAAMDGDTNTFTDTTGNPSWILIDFGAGNERQVGVLRFHPRKGYASRANGALIQGSNDGATFTNLAELSGVNSDVWYAEALSSAQVYRYMRYYSETGNGNVAELEFYRVTADMTLLELFIAEAEEIDLIHYTRESREALQAALAEANAVYADADAEQDQVDSAEVALRTAIDGLEMQGMLLSGPEFVYAGQPLELTVSMQNVTEDVYASSLVVRFDTSLLQYVGVESIAEDYSVVDAVYEDGNVKILQAVTSPGSGGISGTRDLVKLQFVAHAVTDSVKGSVYLSEVIVADGEGTETIVYGGPDYEIEIRTIEVVKTELLEQIAAAQRLIDTAVVHETLWGHVKQSVVDALRAELEAAQAVAGDRAVTQSVVDQATDALKAAIQVFLDSQNKDAGIGDLGVMAAHYGLTSDDSDWESVSMYDMNDDHMLDIVDMSVISKMILEE